MTGPSKNTNFAQTQWIRLNGYAICIWSLLFVAPHIWWMLGIPLAFPEGGIDHATAFSEFSWFVIYNLFVIILAFVALAIGFALIHPLGQKIPRWMLLVPLWIACVLLSLRGLAGLVADGVNDLIWWPTFLIGGILFGTAAWLMHHRTALSDNTNNHPDKIVA